MSDVVDTVADVVEEVAEHAIDFADAARDLSQIKIRFTALGTVVGLAAGAVGGYFLASRRLEARFNEKSEVAIADMREHYLSKITAATNSEAKGDVEELIRDNGYGPTETSVGPPLAVTPPDAVVEAAEAAKEETAPVKPAPAIRNTFRDVAVQDPELPAWDYEREKRKRTPDAPYVIHVDERKEFDYDEVSYTYYAEDDVLCRENDDALSAEEREHLVGEGNLDRFGHGSGDPSIVYIRNDPDEVEIEVVRSPNSYAKEVYGFKDDQLEHSAGRSRRRERFSHDDD